MSHPRENVFSIDYSGFFCRNKKQANKIANQIVAKLKKLVKRDALCIIVLSNINKDAAVLRVLPSNRKKITPKRSWKNVYKHWHIHITFLACPGQALADEIEEYLKQHYPSRYSVRMITDCCIM